MRSNVTKFNENETNELVAELRNIQVGPDFDAVPEETQEKMRKMYKSILYSGPVKCVFFPETSLIHSK